MRTERNNEIYVMGITFIACETGIGEGKGKRKKGAHRNDQVFRFQMPITYVVFKLTIRITSTTKTANFE